MLYEYIIPAFALIVLVKTVSNSLKLIDLRDANERLNARLDVLINAANDAK